jgi:hypothetical protein
MTTATLDRRVKIVPLVVQCQHCTRYHHPSVRFEQGADPVILRFPGYCACGGEVATPDTEWHLVATAKYLMETAHLLKGDAC